MGTSFTRDLSQGMKGEDVKAMQTLLTSAGFSPGAADGDFGPHTKLAVVAFQGAKGLVTDGIVGPKTIAMLQGSGPNPTPGPNPPTPVPKPPGPTPPLPKPRPPNAGLITVCPDGPTVKGIDVSKYQPNTDWQAVKGAGCAFAFSKASEATGWTNPYFPSDWRQMKSSGLIRGAYHFFRANTDPAAQAAHFLRQLSDLGTTDMMMFDWETHDGVSVATQVQHAQIWLDAVEKETGKTPIIYTGPYFFMELGSPEQFERYPLFIAEYGPRCPKIPPPWSHWDFWQYNTGPAVGVQASQADLDEFNGDAGQLERFATSLHHS